MNRFYLLWATLLFFLLSISAGGFPQSQTPTEKVPKLPQLQSSAPTNSSSSTDSSPATTGQPSSGENANSQNLSSHTPDSKTPTQRGSASQMPSARRPAEFESSTVLKATTRLVIIDVVASDARGHAVTDLKPNDFTVLEDARLQNIRAFGFQHPVPRSANAVEPKLPPNVFTNIPRFQQTSALNVVLLDALNTSLPNQAYARQQMIKYLEKMPADQPIAVYTLGTKLRMLQDFTSDPNILKEVVKNYKGQASPLQESPAGGPDVEMFPPGVFESLPAEVQQGLEQFEAERISFQTDNRVRITMEALQALAKSLSGYSGRKNLLWVSEAFPLSILPDSSLGLGAFTVQRNYDQDVLKTANALIDSQVAVYPVDARGLVTIGFNAADSGRDKFGRSRTSGAALSQDLSKQSSALYAAHSTMDDLAQRTGGRAYYNRNDIDGAIRNGIGDGSTYYMIGYYPDNKDWNGKFRKIQIKVDRPGIKLRHRLGYYAADPQGYAKEDAKKRARDLGNALSLDTPISTALLFEAGVIPPSAQTEDKVIVSYAIDAHALSFERGHDGLEHAEVECVVQAYSEKAKPLKSEGTTVSTSLKPETFQRVLELGFPCSRDIALPTGNYLLRLAVRDDRTGLIGTANAHVKVPELPTNPILIRRDQRKPEEKKPDDKKQ